MIKIPYTYPIHYKMMALFNKHNVLTVDVIYPLMTEKFKCKFEIYSDNFDDIVFDNDNDYNWFLLHL